MNDSPKTPRPGRVPAPPAVPPSGDEADEDLIRERLGWTPRQRLDDLLDMLAFEERARRARVVTEPG